MAKKKVSRTRHHSAAMRAKISRAVKASFRRRKAVKSPVRRAIRRVRRSAAPMALAIRRSNPIRFMRRSRRVSSRSRKGGLPSFGGGSILKELTARSTIEMAGGAVGATFITGWVLNTWGNKLPGYTPAAGATDIGAALPRIAYKVAIPTIAAMGVRKFNRNIAQGMILGGVVTAVNEIIAVMRTGSAPSPVLATPVTTPVKGYVDYASRGITRPYNGYVGSQTAGDAVFNSGSPFRQTFGG